MNLNGSVVQILYFGKRIKFARSFQHIDLMRKTASSKFTFDNKDIISTTVQFSKKNKPLIAWLEKYPDLLKKYKNVHMVDDYINILMDYDSK